MIGSVSTVTLFGTLAQVAAYLRMAIIAAALGLTGVVDSYYLGLAIPSLVVAVCGNWVQMTFVARYTALVATDRRLQAQMFRHRVCGIVLLTGALCTVAAFSFPEIPMQLLLDLRPDSDATVAFKYTCLMMLPLMVADFMGQTLNGHQRFAIAAVAPFANAVVAAGSLAVWPHLDLHALIYSLLLGCVVQILIVTPFFLQLPKADSMAGAGASMIGEDMQSVVKATLLVVPAVLLANAMLPILQFSMSRLGDGIVASMSYASRINNGIAQLLVIGLGTVLIPHFATLLAKREAQEAGVLLRKLTRGSVLVCLTICVALALYGSEVVYLLFGRGRFSIADAERVGYLLFLLSLSLLPLAIGTFIARYFNAAQRLDLLLYSGVLSVVMTAVVALLGVRSGSLLLIGCVPLITYLGTMTFWLVALSRLVPMASMLTDFAQALLRATVILIPALGVDILVTMFISEGRLLPLLIRGGVFCLVVGGAGWATRSMQWIVAPQSKPRGSRSSEV